MSYLTLDADRLVRDAVDAFMAGRLRPDPLPDTVYATKNSRYRIIAGIVHEASDTSLMGAELVGWLIEEAGSARIEPRWRTSSRGVFVERKSGHAVVTSRVLTRSVVSESGRPRLGLGASTIPPAPPIPQLKQAPSIAPPELVSLGRPDPLPVRPQSRPSIPDDEVTKVERTEIADADELHALRQTSAHSIPPPPMPPSELPPAPFPDDLDAPTRPVFSAASDARQLNIGTAQPKASPSRPTGSKPSPSKPSGSRPSRPSGQFTAAAPSDPSTSRRSQPPARPTPKLVAPRMPSSRPPPPRPSSRRKTPPTPAAKKPPPPPPSKKVAVPPPPTSSQNPLPPPNPPPRKSR